MKNIFFSLIFIFSFLVSFAQETFPTNGAPDKRHSYYAFTNAKIIVDYQTTIDKGTLLVKDGKIEEVGAAVSLPKGAVVYDLKGKTIYPSLIDIYSTYGMPEIKKEERKFRGPQMENNIKGAFGWNQAIHSDMEADRIFIREPKSAEEMRKLGFGAVMSFKKDGIARGSSVFISLADEKENQIILKEKAAAMYSFDKGTSTQDYPSSLMGSIALLRQTYYDAQCYKSQGAKEEYNISLDAWNKLQSLPQLFEVKDKLSALSAEKI